MAVTFLDPGGDADFGQNLWDTGVGTIVSDIVHGGHKRSIQFPANIANDNTKSGICSDAGGRISLYFYIVALPTATATTFRILTVSTALIIRLRVTSAGVLQLWSGLAQYGSDGPTLSTGKWYRLCLSWTITSLTVNRFELFCNGVSAISLTNVTLTDTGSNLLNIGNPAGDTTYDTRFSDIYVDNSSTLTDTGDIWVTAKRPVSNGTTNGFTTQIGSGGSGYGSGHSPQINERPLSTTNGWSMVGAGSAVTEEYTVEGKTVGDINIASARIVDYMGWVYAKSLSSETGKIVVGGAQTNISLTSTNTMFTQIAGTTTYPAGGTDIGIITSTDLTTVSLYECGVMVAYIPNTGFMKMFY